MPDYTPDDSYGGWQAGWNPIVVGVGGFGGFGRYRRGRFRGGRGRGGYFPPPRPHPIVVRPHLPGIVVRRPGIVVRRPAVVVRTPGFYKKKKYFMFIIECFI